MTQFRKQSTHRTRFYDDQRVFGDQGFTCVQCRQYVTCATLVAGVHNRNHCPACLWSRHLDGRIAGDRLAGCRGAMRPIGLTTKLRRNRYARERDGELMLIHRCTGCQKIVINRIAADDSVAALLEVFERSYALDDAAAAALDAGGVSVLRAHDQALVRRRLLGA